jgi:hypothetical protein
MMSGLHEQVKERRILKDEDKGTSYLAIQAAQDLFLKMLILRN